ncbi:two-component flavin-dependent monooxygenase [Lentzea xinjiangensis]|uniref:Two-component flavin-dependent monooxygenase n=1 Tax=Lentzea xinjiangensis TaxID=402600 RepID=A0A1H9HSN2_9PSEU|nr:acyl-CoA dehydrogenase family protein [Lentzea xinjiangensis]SEQ65262.1 two-component flavin-dependent monooxygenase [Lentzea xinjiangensis]
MTAQNTGLAAAAEKVKLIAAEHAAQADATRKLAPEVVEALREAGFARHFVAAGRGGAQGTFAELTEAVLLVGQGCSAAAWCASLSAYSSRFAALLPREGHDEIWASGPDAFVVTGQPPMGKGTAVDGGHRLSGRWTYVSGVDFADWALLCGVVGEEGRFFAVPRKDFTVLETWDSVGMKATSSHSVVVDDVFVPSHLSFSRTDLVTGTSWSPVESHNVPFQAVGGLTFAAPAVGAAMGALDACVSVLSGKKQAVTSAVDLVRASGQVESAKLLVEQNARVLDDREFTPAAMARNERNVAYAAEVLVDAVGGLVRAAGTSGLAEGGALQRFWRDVVSSSSHVALRYETASVRTYPASLYG